MAIIENSEYMYIEPQMYIFGGIFILGQKFIYNNLKSMTIYRYSKAATI